MDLLSDRIRPSLPRRAAQRRRQLSLSEQIHHYRPNPLRGLSGTDLRLRLRASVSGYRFLALDPRHHRPSGGGGRPAQVTGGTEAAGRRIDGGAEQAQNDHRMRTLLRRE